MSHKSNKLKTLALALLVLLPSVVVAQVDKGSKFEIPALSGLDGFGGGSSDGNVAVSAKFFTDESGTRGLLEVAVDVSPGWHIYSISQPADSNGMGPQRTNVVVSPSSDFRHGPFAPDQPPTSKPSEVYSVPEEYHNGRVIWRSNIEISPGVDPQRLTIQGKIDGQICTDDARACLPLDVLDTSYTAAYGGVVQLLPTTAAPMAADEVATSGVEEVAISVIDPAMLMSNILWGILGGLILNLMPCVLPVVGLKLLSFVEQAHGSRSRAFQLNLVYTAGILSVFLVLASLAVSFQMGWGQHFQSAGFQVTMIVLVFAMALSFLGVWEIPIPGFVGSGKSSELAAQEGVAGAFFKGVFTTLLATPCSGPFLGPVFGYTLSQPPIVTYVIMLSVGVGLALPYLIVGAFPELMRWIPKPGAWMDTFKQIMGFVLLGTVVYLFTMVNKDLFIPVLALLFGVWFGCWWIGRIPFSASTDRKVAGWIGGVALATAIGFFSFQYLVPQESHIDWRPFSPSALDVAKQEGRTIMVDFTADWCPTCQWNTKMAIDTEGVGSLVEQLGVIPLLADWSDKSDTIKDVLASHDSRSIPLLVIYPASNPDEPIVLRDVLQESQVIDAIMQATDGSVQASTQTNQLGSYKPG